MQRNRWIQWLLVAVVTVMMGACGGGGGVELNPDVAKIVNWAKQGGTPPTAEDYAAAGVDLNGHSADEINRYIEQYYAAYGTSNPFDSVKELNDIAKALGVTLLDSDGDGTYDAFDDDSNGGGNGDGDEESNTSIPISSLGIHVAQSAKQEDLRQNTILHPLIDDSHLYLHRTTVRGISGESNPREINISVTSYDLSRFDTDKNMSQFPATSLYEKSTTVNSLHTYGFDVIHHNLVKRDNYLYFSTSPDSVDSKTQGSLIKYDLRNRAQIYHAKTDAINGYEDDPDDGNYFDLTRGWFVPFDDEHIGVVSGHISKVVLGDNGGPLAYDEPYFSGPLMQDGTYSYGSPVSNDKRYFHIERNTPAGYHGLLNVKYIADGSAPDAVKFGNRDIHNNTQNCDSADIACQYKNPNYKLTRIPDDFKAFYLASGGEKLYDYSNGEFTFIANNQNMFMDNGHLFVPIQIRIDSDETSNYDSYIMEYDMNSTVVALHFIEGTNRDSIFGFAPIFYDFTKYGDVVYYIGESASRERLLVAYNMKTKSFVYKKDITQPRDSNNVSLPQDYIITGDTIIIINKIVQSVDYYFDMVFDIVNIHTGKTIKRLQHSDLQGLHSGYYVSCEGSVSDQNSVYFLLRKDDYDNHTSRRVIVKIDSLNNKVIKEQYRYDYYMSNAPKSN